jgi:hypothetical protein
MATNIDTLLLQCTQIVDQITPLFISKFNEYEQVEQLIENAIVRSHLTGKSPAITTGIQYFLDALIKNSCLEEQISKICKEIDQTTIALMSGTLSPVTAYTQLDGLKSRLHDIQGSITSVSQEMTFAKKLIRRETIS